MRRLWFVVVAWFALSSSLSAQTICQDDCTFVPGEAVAVFADTGVDPGWIYALLVNGEPGPEAYRFENGAIVYDFPFGFLAGTYGVRLEASDGAQLVSMWVNNFVVAEPPPERCAEDGTGNGIDEDGDGLTDEICLPDPPPEPGCSTGGTLVPIGSLLSWSGKHGEADSFIAAREAEGWALLSRNKVRNVTTLRMECRG